MAGNRFSVVLRSVRREEAPLVAAACERVKSQGFVNYFGLQRFGKGGAPSHAIGLALLRGE